MIEHSIRKIQKIQVLLSNYCQLMIRKHTEVEAIYWNKLSARIGGGDYRKRLTQSSLRGHNRKYASIFIKVQCPLYLFADKLNNFYSFFSDHWSDKYLKEETYLLPLISPALCLDKYSFHYLWTQSEGDKF